MSSLNSLNPPKTTKPFDSSVEHLHLKLHRVAATHLFDKLTHYQRTHSLEPGFRSLRTHARQQRHLEGASLLTDWASRRLLSKALIQWLKSVYHEEILLQESLEAIRERKLAAAIAIGQASHNKEEVMVERCFRQWKRQGYEMVLEGLKTYS